MSITIPDVSEYQSVDFDVFSGPIIVRAHNSVRPDRHWAAHAQGASRQPWWGAYQYLTAGADPADAARAFLATLGGYRPNVTILDLEEGTGDQRARQHAWLEVMAADPAADWTYSGLYFARSHLDGSVDWIAAYGQREPTDAHALWQFTNAQPFPGIGPCDGSVFQGSLAELLALTSPGAGAAHQEESMPKFVYVRRDRPNVINPVYAVSESAVVKVMAFTGHEWLYCTILGHNNVTPGAGVVADVADTDGVHRTVIVTDEVSAITEYRLNEADGLDEQAIADAVLGGLDPKALADRIAALVGADAAKKVADEIATRLRA